MTPLPGHSSPVVDVASGRRLVDALRVVLADRCGGPADLLETHISWVLLAGESAYKIKKPVRLDFLDFGTLEARRACCEEELRLNRRLAPSLYLAVVPITGSTDAPSLEARDVPIEYAVKMRRFADDALFSRRVVDGRLVANDVDRLATRLARFHAQAAVASAGDRFGAPAQVEATMRATLERLQGLVGPLPGRLAWLEAQATALRSHWDRRLRSGRVREGHGDLHLANAIVLPDEVTAFDCLEFDPALRWIDVVDDIAFMTMDLMAHGRGDLGWRFLGRYLEDSGDYDGLTVLRPYLVHRALVRALVGAIRERQGVVASPSGDDYLALASRLAGEGRRPRLVITRGLSGSGKTVMSQALLEASGAVRVRSDLERKRLFGVQPLESSAGRASIYDPVAGARTYERLREVARTALAAGFDVIVDATFLERARRSHFARLADDAGAAFAIVECRADAPVLRERVRARAARGDDASEATGEVLDRQQRADEPLDAHELARTVVVDTTAAVRIGQVTSALARLTG